MSTSNFIYKSTTDITNIFNDMYVASNPKTITDYLLPNYIYNSTLKIYIPTVNKYSSTSSNGTTLLSTTPTNILSYTTPLSNNTDYQFKATPVSYKYNSTDFSELFCPNWYYDYFGNPDTNNKINVNNSATIYDYTNITSTVVANVFTTLNIPIGCTKVYFLLIGGGGTSGWGSSGSGSNHYGSPGGSGGVIYGDFINNGSYSVKYYVGGCESAFGINSTGKNTATMLSITDNLQNNTIYSAGSGSNGENNYPPDHTGGIGGTNTYIISNIYYNLDSSNMYGSAYIYNSTNGSSGTQSLQHKIMSSYYDTNYNFPAQPDKTISYAYGAGSQGADHTSTQQASSTAIGSGTVAGTTGNNQTGGYVQFWYIF